MILSPSANSKRTSYRKVSLICKENALSLSISNSLCPSNRLSTRAFIFDSMKSTMSSLLFSVNSGVNDFGMLRNTSFIVFCASAAKVVNINIPRIIIFLMFGSFLSLSYPRPGRRSFTRTALPSLCGRDPFFTKRTRGVRSISSFNAR